MLSFSHKSKQYLLVVLKVLVLGLVLWFIYDRIKSNDTQTFDHFTSRLLLDEQHSILYVCIAISLCIVNWWLEIKKWHVLINTLQVTPFKNALRDTLAGSTLAFVSPAKIGDYGIKASYYATSNRKKVLLLNLYGNLSQMCITIIFGLIACFYMAYIQDYHDLNVAFPYIIVAGVGSLLLLFVFRKKEWFFKGLSIETVALYFKALSSKIMTKVGLISLLRYFIFSFCFYIFLYLYGANVTLVEALPSIFAMYFLSSLLPSFFIVDVATRGGIAAVLLSPLAVSALPVLCAALSMWILNFALPAILGTYYIITFKRSQSV